MYQNALEGVRVVDLSWVVAGPFCTRLLGLMGAEVIKVETSTLPQYVNGRRAGWFNIMNNSKKSCTINLSTDAGKELVKRLIAISDMVVENFSTGVMERLGLGYDDLRAINEDIIYVSSSGLGRTGPGRDYLAYGTLLQGLSGWTSLYNEPNRKMEAMGVVPGCTDPVTGLWEAYAIMAALFHRSRTGKGVYIDLSMLESTITVMGDRFLEFEATERLPKPGETSVDTHAVPHGVYPCSEEDSWIAISARTEAEWKALLTVMGNPDWGREEPLESLEGRLIERKRIDSLVEERTRREQMMELFHRLQAAGVPAGPCYSVRQLMDDPQMLRRGLYDQVPLRDGRTQIATAIPWRDGTNWKGNLFGPPAMGEHNDHVFLGLLGMSQEEYEGYRRAGVLE